MRRAERARAAGVMLAIALAVGAARAGAQGAPGQGNASPGQGGTSPGQASSTAGQPGGATGQGTGAPEAVFAEGLASFEAGRYAEAVATWEGLLRAVGEERGFKVLYNLGLAYEARGDATRAIERFEAFLARLSAQPSELTRDLEERRQDAAERARALKAARGAVEVPAPPGRACAVRIDGAEPRPAGFTAYLSPGEHAIEVFAGSKEARTVRIQAEAGKAQSVDTSPPAAPPPPPRVVVVQAGEAKPQLPSVWVLGGGTLAVASLALPLGLGLHAADLRSEAEALGRGHTQYAERVRQFEGARTAYLASYAAPAVLGAATLAVAAAFVVRLRLWEPRARGAAAPAAALSVTPGGVWLRGGF